jgi:hypothetical protein
VTTPRSSGLDGETSTPYLNGCSTGANPSQASVNLYAIVAGATVKIVSIFGGVTGPLQQTSASGGPFSSILQLVSREPSIATIVPRTRKPPSHATLARQLGSKIGNARKQLLTMLIHCAGRGGRTAIHENRKNKSARSPAALPAFVSSKKRPDLVIALFTIICVRESWSSEYPRSDRSDNPK